MEVYLGCNCLKQVGSSAVEVEFSYGPPAPEWISEIQTPARCRITCITARSPLKFVSDGITVVISGGSIVTYLFSNQQIAELEERIRLSALEVAS